MTQAITRASPPARPRAFNDLFGALPAEIRFQILNDLPHPALSCLADATPSDAWSYHDDLAGACARALVDELRLFWPRPDMRPRDKFVYFAQASSGAWHQSPNFVALNRSLKVVLPSPQYGAFLAVGRAPLRPPPLEHSGWQLDVLNRNLLRSVSGSEAYWEIRLQQAVMLCMQQRAGEAQSLIDEIWANLTRVPIAATKLLEVAIQTANEPLFAQSLSYAQDAAARPGSGYLTNSFELCIKTLQFRCASQILARLRASDKLPSLKAHSESASFKRFVEELAMLLVFRVDDVNLPIKAGDAQELLTFLQHEKLAPSAQHFLAQHL